MVLLTILIQLFALIKNALVASYFGIGIELDAFNLSNRISTFIYSFIGAGISTVIIPYLRDKVNKKSIDIFISVIYTAGLVLLMLLIIFRKEIILLAGGSNNNYFLALASNILIFTALTGFINSLIQLAKGIIEFNDGFIKQKIIVLISNILLVLLLVVGDQNIYYYASIVLFTAIINLLFHSFLLRKTNFKFNINYDIKNQNFREMMILFFPTMLSTGVYQLSLLIDTLIAARLPEGSISTLSYANSVISMINILFLGNITSFVYPKLVKKNNNKERQNSLINYILLVHVLMSLLILLFYSSGREGISILFERGNFVSENTTIVFIIALILAHSLPTNAIRDLLYRYFYMNKDTFTPFTNSIVISLINIALSLILSIYFGLYGVVFGTVLASYFSLTFISIKFKKKFPIYFNIKSFFLENLKILIVTMLSVIAIIIFKNIISFDNIIMKLIVYTVFSLIIFFLLLKLLNSKVFKIKL